MANDLRTRTMRLRDEAWADVEASPSFIAFKALDDAVAKMGGDETPDANLTQVGKLVSGDSYLPQDKNKVRVSQPDAAEAILNKRGIPTSGADLLVDLPANGAVVSGANHIINFTSSMSKSGRFKSIRRNGGYFWWFRDKPLPPGWEEPEVDSFDGLLTSGSKVHSNQKGRVEHDPATT